MCVRKRSEKESGETREAEVEVSSVVVRKKQHDQRKQAKRRGRRNSSGEHESRGREANNDQRGGRKVRKSSSTREKSRSPANVADVSHAKSRSLSEHQKKTPPIKKRAVQYAQGKIPQCPSQATQ
jgi:hypothetical protein